MVKRPMTGFRIAFTFPNAAFLHNNKTEEYDGQTVLEASLAKSRPTVLEYWGPPTQSGIHGERNGLVIGCQDGTVYVLHHLPSSPSVTIDDHSPQVSEPPRPKNPPRFSKSANSNSRSRSPPATPSFNHSPNFSVTTKLRVVSGISTEQVEAPKNYVDFEDEADKLKDILKGKNPRERHSISEGSSDRTPKSNASSIIEPVPISKRRNPAPRSLLSATNSRAPTPPSFSQPASPRDPIPVFPIDLHPWTLRYHVIPSRSGFGHAVKSIQFLNLDRYFAVLQETGDLHVFASDDGTCVASFRVGEELGNVSLAGINDRPYPHDTWVWSRLLVSYIEESVIFVVTAANDNDNSELTPYTEEGLSGTSRCVVLEFITTVSDARLQRLGQWDLDGPGKGDGIYEEPDGSFTFFSTSHDGHFIVRKFTLRTPLQSPPHQSSVASHLDIDAHYGPHLSTLPIPNPFKAIMSHSSEYLGLNEGEARVPSKPDLKPSLSEPHDTGILTLDTISGLKCHYLANGKLSGMAWTRQEISVFEYSQRSMALIFRSAAICVEDVSWLDDDLYALSFKDRVEIYRIRVVNADNEELDVSRSTYPSILHAQPEFLRTLPVGNHDAIKFVHGSLVTIDFSEDQQEQKILLHSISDVRGTPQSPQDVPQVLWRRAEIKSSFTKVKLTSTLPLELEWIVQGYSDGVLRRFSLAQMTRKSEKPSISASSSMKTSTPSLSGHVIGLHVVQNPRTRERYIVGGGDDGSIGFWLLNTFQLVARWTIFVTPLAKVVQFEAETTGPLHGCALCVSRDGTIAIIVIDGFHFRYLIPGSVAPLKRICLSSNNLMMIYGNHRARFWDAQTKELRRSFGEDKADEILAQGGWTELCMESDASLPTTVWSSLADSYDGQDAAASLLLNLERVIVDAISVTKTISTSRDEVREILLALDRLRLFLSVLLTPGLNADVDSICYGKLGAYPSSALVGLSSTDCTTLFQPGRPEDAWSLSPNVSASRALAIVAVLKAMSLFEDLTEGANTVISFYTTSLGACVGPHFKSPSLEFLGRHWFEASNELRQPIRTLFDAAIANMSDEESITVTEKWQHHVPSLQPDAEKETSEAALALFICGCIASEKYSLLSTSALSDICKSISLYLNDEKSIYRILAIDLCSRGFNVWQHYIDAMDILRSLFDLATNVRKDAISIQNISAQARLAVLSIASNNMPLFMGTLCLDILSPPTMEHQRSVLQILAFLIRKRPYVLQSNLPRLMEAVVKSLDPNSTTNREMVLDTATEIVGYVVKTFPTVDFHMATQRLAVGTNEGALVMSDLKTAIRLYVLEGHKKPITACSFSPDGRRLVTISLKESSVLVWKVGSSFASFFNPGAPPRQGHSGSQPFKTLNFNIGEEADMTTAETLDLVRVEWIADRSVRVKIRQNILTFST